MNRYSCLVRFTYVAAFLLCDNAQGLTVGDITVLGFRTKPVDQFSFITWVNIDEGTQLFFTDSSFNGVDFTTFQEESVLWTVPAPGLVAGQIVVSSQNEFGDSQLFDVGGVSSGEISSLADTGDNLFVFDGTSVSDPPIFGINFANNNSWVSSNASPTDSYLPGSLAVTGGNISVSPAHQEDHGHYNGLRTFPTLASAKAAVFDVNNWTFSTSNSFTLSSEDFTILPEPSSLTMLLFGGIAAIVLRRTLHAL